MNRRSFLSGAIGVAAVVASGIPVGRRDSNGNIPHAAEPLTWYLTFSPAMWDLMTEAEREELIRIKPLALMAEEDARPLMSTLTWRVCADPDNPEGVKLQANRVTVIGHMYGIRRPAAVRWLYRRMAERRSARA